MRLNKDKELTPVIYGKKPIKILDLYQKDSGELCFNIHWHERFELLLIKSGSLVLKLNNNELTVSENSVAIIPPGKTHMGIAGSGGVSYYTFMFDIATFNPTSYISESFFNPILNQEVDFEPLTSNNEIINVLEETRDEYFNEDGFSSIVITGKIYEIIGLLYRKCLTQRSPQEIIDSEFSKILKYISDNCLSNISTQSISKQYGYNEAYLCRKFKKLTGLSPTNYINILRLEHSKKRLKSEKEVKISTIAASSGFSDAGYFARCFKKYYGITPNEYRKQGKS